MEPKPAFKFRKLRIAWSVAWGIAALMLVVLWARSYRGCDVVYWQASTRTALFSATGVIGISKSNFEAIPGWGWNKIELMPGPTPTWEFHSDNNGTRLRFPHRLPIAIAGVLVVAPWIRQLRWSFSLRSLLLATTVVAVGLGLIIFAAKN